MFSTKIYGTTNAVTVGQPHQDGEDTARLVRVWLVKDNNSLGIGRIAETRAEYVPQGIANVTEAQWLAGNIPKSPFYCR